LERGRTLEQTRLRTWRSARLASDEEWAKDTKAKAKKQSKPGKRGSFIEGKKTGDQTHGVMIRHMYLFSIIIPITAVVKIRPTSVNYA
jgi:hypothetical protein